MNELLSKLPVEIAEKIKAETITEEEIKQYLQPLAEQYKDQLTGFAPLSDDDLEEVNGGTGFISILGCGLASIFSGDPYDECMKRVNSQAKIDVAGRRQFEALR